MEYSDIYVQRIRRLCAKRRITVHKLAVMSGVPKSTLDNIMQGHTKNPGVKALHQIALAFSMTLAEFFDFPELNDYSFDEETDE